MCFIWTVILLYLCLSPTPPHIDGPLGWDKLQHAAAFGLFAFFAFKSLIARPSSLFLTCIIAFISATTLGGVIELLQGWLTVNRKAEFLDFTADAIGAFIAVFIMYLLSIKEVTVEDTNNFTPDR